MSNSQQDAPQIGRPLIDVNVDMSNRIESEDINTILISTFEDIANVLSDHCGPYGKFAMIVNPSNRVAEPVFTKDGIGIVRAMEYMSPMQEFVRTTLAYMGSRVETAAGDGTTSSMIILAKGLIYLLNALKSSKYLYSFTDLKNIYEEFSEDLITLIKTNCYSEDTLVIPDKKTFIYNVAYSQAYTSSHGDRELAKAVAELFSSTPKEAWNYMHIDKCRLESSKSYTTEKDDSQYSIQNARIWPQSALISDLGTSRKVSDETVLISGIAPDNAYQAAEEFLHDILTRISNNEQFTVICPKQISSFAQTSIQDAIDAHPEADVAFILIDDDDPRLNDIACIKALANNMNPITEHKLTYVFEKNELKINSGLYPNEENSDLNPNVGKEEYASLNYLIEHLDKVITQIKNEVSNKNLNQEIKRLQKFRLKLTVAKRSYFLIGGAAYDNVSAVDVVIDAILAVKHSFKNGFGLGGNKTLYYLLEIAKSKLDNRYASPKFKELYGFFIDMLKEGILSVHKAVLKHFNKFKITNDYMGKSVDITTINELTNKYPEVDIFDVLSNKYLADPNKPIIIIQPINTDIELVKRFGELALKFVKTERIIAPGGICTKTKNHSIEHK